MDTYLEGKKKDDFIFPVVKRSELLDQHQDIRDARIKYNRRLKEIAKLCDIEENLTSYVSLHSMAILKDLPINALSNLQRTGEIEAKWFDNAPNKVLDCTINFTLNNQTIKFGTELKKS